MSRYQIHSRQTDGMTVYVLADTVRKAEAIVYPEFGNNCMEFRTTSEPTGNDSVEADSAPVELFVPPTSLDELRQHSPFHAGLPILFPFPNRVRNGVYTFEGHTYSLAKLLAKGWDRGAGQAIHGLVADRVWTVESTHADDTGAAIRSFLQLDAIPDIFEQYPFGCRLTVTYRLREGVLEMHIEVSNTGEKTLPMGFGIHPWFPVALRPNVTLPAALTDITPAQRQQAQVHVPAAALWELDHLMPTGNILPVEGTEFDLRAFCPLGEQSFDHVFTGIQRRADGWAEGGLRDPATGLEMFVAADAGFREWVFYAPLNRNVIALEPYTCTTDAVNLQARGIDAGLIALPAGQTWKGEIHFGLRLAAR